MSYTDRIYLFDAQKGNRRLAKGVKNYDLKGYLAGVREGICADLFDEVTIECRKNNYSYEFPTVTCFVGRFIQSRADFLRYCELLGHGPKDCVFVTQDSSGGVRSVHKTLQGVLGRAKRDNTYADFRPLEE